MTVPLKLLVIEDVPADFMLLERSLRQNDLAAECQRVCSNAELDAALENEWDAVLADYNVPGMEFLSSLRRVKQRWPDLPVILVSGSIGEEAAVGLLHSGMTDFIFKSHLNRLPDAIRRALKEVDERRARDAAENALRASQAAALEEQRQARLAALNLMEDAVAARQHAEAVNAALYESQKRFSDIVAASADWIWEVNAEAAYTFASDSVFDVLGYLPAEILGKTPFDLMPPHEAEQVRAKFQEIASRRKPFRDLDNVNRHKDGSLRYVQTNGMPILGEHGKLLGYRGLDRDVTDKKRAELELAASEQRFRTLFENAAVSIKIHNKDTGEILDANRRAIEAYGFSTLEELQGYDCWLDSPYSLEEAVSWIHKAVSEGPQRFEWKCRKCNGSIFWEDVQLNTLTLNGKEWVLSITTDITARKQAEVERDLFSDALRQSAHPLLLIDADDNITYFNPAFTRLFGYQLEEMAGKHASCIAPQTDEHQAQQKELLHQLHETGFWSGELDRLASDGALIPTAANMGSIRGKQGELLGFVVSYLDLRPLHEKDASLRKLSLAVEQSPESIVITNLAGNIEYVNEAFVRNTGYSREEALGKNPRILQSGKTPESTYDALWNNLEDGLTWQGELYNRRKDGSEYTEYAIISPIRQPDGRITHYVAIKEDITEKKRAEAEIHRLAFYDSLTGLPNRALLLERTAQALATIRRVGEHSALILLNIDRFKTVNDAGGQSLGDDLIKAMGERLAALMHEGDVVARLGGDEFCILLSDLAAKRDSSAHRALHVSEKIHASLQQPFRLSEESITVTACLGIALFPAKGEDTPLEILRRANTALHHAKTRGNGQSAFFESVLDDTAKHRFDVERELHQAIANGELRLYLQPQVDAAGKVVGAEALVRWQHPQRGLIPPGAFIPVAEESNLIIEIGTWVFMEVCRLLARNDMTTRSIRISVNISPRHFRQSGFVEQIKRGLAETGADPTHLTLEVTEGMLIDNIKEVIAKMTELSMMGIHFSMDDFGTGYSSLSYLKRLPIHELKIDKSFIQDLTLDPEDDALVETILAVARLMNLKVVAEGVETTAQAEFLNQRGEVIHQGYLFGKPRQAELVIAEIARNGN